MWQFDMFFPIIMIVLPAILGLFVGTRPEGGDESGERRHATARARRQLIAWTVAALALYGVLRWIGTGSAIIDEIADFMWLACFPLWFMGAMPQLQSQGYGLQPHGKVATTIVASLVRRDVLSTALRGLLMACWILWGALALTTLVVLLRSTEPHWWVLVFTAIGALELLLGGWLARSAGLEPEPLDPAATADLQNAYANLRRLKQWVWFGSAALAMALFTLIGLLMAWDEIGQLATAIWVALVGGVLFGSTGAVVGLIADNQRARIIRRFHELTASPTA